MATKAQKLLGELSDRQILCLKVLKRAPKTTADAYDQIIKKNSYASKQAVGACMRTLENRGLVRARSKQNNKIKRDVILWELTAQGRKVLA